MKFSDRTQWNFTPNALALAIAARRAEGAVLCDLTVSNPTVVDLPLGASQRAVVAALANPSALRYEPDPRGILVAREAVAAYYRGRNLSVDPSHIMLCASTSEAYGWLFKLLCDPGDEVLVAHPSYPLFDDLARLEGVRLRPFPLVYEGAWRIDLDALGALASSTRARAIAIVHPNNPTGSFVTLGEQEKLNAVCREFGLALIVDEVFGDHALVPDAMRAPSFVTVNNVLTFTLSGLSKVAALPQMKLGWIVVGGPASQRAEAMQRLEMVADCYLSVGAPVQHAAGVMLRTAGEAQQAIRSRVEANLATLRLHLARGSSVSLLRVEGGWCAVLRVPRTRSEEEWCIALLEQDGVIVSPGYFFDFASEAYLVVSLIVAEESFRTGIARLVSRIDSGT